MRQDLNGHLCRLVEELVGTGLTLEQARREFEKQFIVAALQRNDGNLSCSARTLGIHRNTLRNKVAKLDISLEAVGARSRPRRRPRS